MFALFSFYNRDGLSYYYHTALSQSSDQLDSKSYLMIHLHWRQFLALLAGFTVMLVQGSLYIYGTITPYIITYLHNRGDNSLTISDLSIISALAIIFTNVGIFFSNFRLVSFSNRITSIVSSLGIALSMLLLSFSTQFYLYVILYGVVYGFFIGFGYMAPLKNCYDHLPDRKGLCSGTCLMGFGLGAFFFNFIVVALVNPDNEKQDRGLFPEGVGENMPFALQIMAIIYAVIGIVGAALISPPLSKDEQFLPLVNPEKEELSEGHYSRQALKLAYDNKVFLLTFLLATCTPYGLFVAFNYKQYGLIQIHDDHYLSILGSIGSVSNGVSRMVWGISMDLYPFRSNILAMLSVFAVGCITILWSGQNKVTYLITVVSTYFCYGGLYSVFPTQTVRMLGRVVGPKLYYLTFVGFSLGVIIQYVSHKFLVEAYGTNGYLYCFILYGALLVVAFGVVLTTEFPQHAGEAIRGQKLPLVVENQE